jgi:hypothetical protein
MGNSSIRVFLGVMWIILGITTLARSNRDESDAGTLATLFNKPETKTAKQRGWETGAGFGFLFIGLLHFVLAFLSHSS